MRKADPRILEAVEHPVANKRTDALTARFNEAYAIFNENSDRTIGGWLDENVTVFSVSSNRPITGIKAVENYFLQQFADCPQFNPVAPQNLVQCARMSSPLRPWRCPSFMRRASYRNEDGNTIAAQFLEVTGYFSQPLHSVHSGSLAPG